MDVFPLFNFHTESSKFLFTAQMTVKNNILNKEKLHTYLETDKKQNYVQWRSHIT